MSSGVAENEDGRTGADVRSNAATGLTTGTSSPSSRLPTTATVAETRRRSWRLTRTSNTPCASSFPTPPSLLASRTPAHYRSSPSLRPHTSSSSPSTSCSATPRTRANILYPQPSIRPRSSSRRASRVKACTRRTFTCPTPSEHSLTSFPPQYFL